MFRMVLVAATAIGFASPAVNAQRSIAEIVSLSGGEFDQDWFDYDLLLNAVITADLVDALGDEAASLTVFAPNDFAFLKTARDLGFTGTDEEGAWNFLVAALTGLAPDGNPVPILRDILLYHVVEGEVTVVDFLLASFFREEVPTLQGGTLTPNFVSIGDKDPDLRDPLLNVFGLDVPATNGVIHSIRRVLIPLDL